MFETLHAREVEWILRLQEFTGWGAWMNWLSNLGPSPYLLGLTGLIYIAWDRALGSRLLAAYFAGQVLGHFAKVLFHEPRPYWIDPRIQGLEPNTASYGFPSGHSLVATVIWLLLARATRRTWPWFVAILAVMLVSLSRVYLGVHFPSDVVGGWLLGGALVILFARGEPALPARLANLTWQRQIALSVLVSLSVFGLGTGLRAALAGTPDPVAWAEYSATARSLQRLGAYSGAILGLGVGLAMSVRWAPFDAGGAWRARLLRVLVLAAPGAIYWLRPRGLMKDVPEITATAVFFVSSAAAAWAFTMAAPWLFLKIGLARSGPADIPSLANHQR